MGILERFGDIMKANINALLDKCENPEKMIDQYLRDMSEDLADVKKNTASVMSEEKRAKVAFDRNQAEIKRFSDLSERAVGSGNDGDALQFIQKKQELEQEGAQLQKVYQLARANADKMRQMHDKLVDNINDLKRRREMVIASASVAKAVEKVNEYSADSGAIDKFGRMEERINSRLDNAMSMAELNEEPVDETEALADKYGASGTAEDELAALKARMNKN